MKSKLLLLLTFGFGLALTAILLFSLSTFGAKGTHAASLAVPPARPPTGDSSVVQNAVTTTVGLVPDETGISNTISYNWMSYQGLLRAENELGVVGTVYTPTDSSDYEAKLQACADDGNDLCISVGFQMSAATLSIAGANPGTDFAIVDNAEYEVYPDNLRGMWFAYDEMGYLAGTLAGLMSQSNVVGDIGGPQYVPAVVELVEGYRNGAQCANPEVEVLIEYAHTFGDPELGAAIAQGMMDQGADVVFAPAGATGAGAIFTTTQSGAWGIGIDTDWYISHFENGTIDGADKLLSSAMKFVDNTVFDTISDVVSGTFTSGTFLYNLELEGIGLAPFHEADPFVPQSVRDALSSVEQGIISGTIDVSDSCIYPIYLPLILKNFEIVPETSLLLRMNEGTGASWFFDASRNGNYGSCSGDACPISGVVGVFGNALSFDGVDDYVQVSDSALPSGSAPRTMAFWMKPEFDARIPVFYGDPQLLASNAYYVLVQGNTACIGEMGGGPLEVCGSTDIIDGNWHFVAMTYDGVDSVLLYLDDGTLEASVTKTYNTTLTGELRVGRLTYEYYTGLIDELVIYDRALSVEEIKALYSSGP